MHRRTFPAGPVTIAFALLKLADDMRIASSSTAHDQSLCDVFVTLTLVSPARESAVRAAAHTGTQEGATGPTGV